MRLSYRFAIWLAAYFAAALALAAAFAVAIGVGQRAEDQAVVLRLLGERAVLLAFAAMLLLGLLGGIVAWLFRRHVTATRALAEQTRVVLANPQYRVESRATVDLRQLAAEINRLAAAHQDLQRDFDARIAEVGEKLAEERNRLAALMSELTEGVLVCTLEGRILLYNEQARALFGPYAAATSVAPVGLGRSVFTLINRAQIAHAIEKLERLLRLGGASPSTRFVTATAAGRLLRVRAAPFVGTTGAVAGMVLALEDVTATLDHESKRRALLQELAAGLRAPVANIRAAAESLESFPDIEPERRGRFIAVVVAEASSLSRRLDEALRDYADALKASLLLEDVRAIDLLEVVRQRLEAGPGIATVTDRVSDDLWLRVDSFALVQVFAFLAARLRDETGVRHLQFSARRAGALAEIDMAWRGMPLSVEALARWETDPMQIGAESTPLSVRDVIEKHGGEAWCQSANADADQVHYIRFQLPAGEAVQPEVRTHGAGHRPEYYDFDLFRDRGVPLALQERPLPELSYTAFDTETTGLEPSAGDEIISIGAVRIVNGRLLRSEFFEQLVNPRRRLSRDSARIHGITAEELAGQPTIEAVLPAFHRFCEDTVLVAHNAAFDMRFLELKEASSGVHFEQPVLDTLLLSAVVHPSQEDHSLEAIAGRLGVRVIGRHTALGDAMMTGEIFLRLVPLLADRRIATLGDALEASRQTYYARLQY